jgi:hypothetical protein
VVDIYNSSNNKWTTASLSQARINLVATSVGNLAFFAGGNIDVSFWFMETCFINLSPGITLCSSGYLQLFQQYMDNCFLITNSLRFSGHIGGKSGLLCRWYWWGNFWWEFHYSQNTVFAVVDIYNSLNNTWTTASLSQARAFLATTSVGNLAIFAGGFNGVSFWLVRTC